MKNNKLKKQSGITLIALVITIIVMMILIEVTISMAINGGLFDYARRAVSEMQNAIDKEQELANLLVNMTEDELIDKYSPGEDIVGLDGEIFSALYKETKEYKDKNGKIAVIPKGFSVGKSAGINTIDGGLVIQDAKGNQFVWIPVNYTESKIKDENGLDTGFTSTFKRSNIDDTDYSEPYVSGYSDRSGTQEAADYYDMMKSVQDNYGFYIGRYEAGTTEERKYDFDNETDTLVVKRDAIPYNYVAWGKSMTDYKNIIKYDFDNEKYSETGKNQGKGAVLLSKELYGKTTDVGKYGAVSTLCYGVQWDAMLRFMGKDTETDSSNWGNYPDNDIKITRSSAKYNSYNDSDSQWIPVTEEISFSKLLTTGADDSFAVKNIFDVAGNCCEWTLEADSSSYRTVRGGFYSDDGDNRPALYRNSYYLPYYCFHDLSFRPVLYITNK